MNSTTTTTRRAFLGRAGHCGLALLASQAVPGVLRATPLGGAAYVAAKFGMAALGLVLAAEEKDSGVRVSNVYPGEIDTPILSARPKPITEEHRATILKPEDVAEAVLFVASLPPRVSIPELVIKPTAQLYW